MLNRLEEKTLSGTGITRDDAVLLSSLTGTGLISLLSAANRIRDHFRGGNVDLCSIVNAKSGACGEDCSFCAQSAKSRSDINSFPLLDRDIVLAAAETAAEGGSRRFCIVTSGRRVSGKELDRICGMISGVRALGLHPCATLGLLSESDLLQLSQAGLERYHNNLESSEAFFPRICTTHTFREKVGTLKAAKAAGLSVCSGGIFGLGESWEDRIDLAFSLKELGPDSVPINFLTPIAGTLLASRRTLAPLDALKIIGLYRFILPQKEIRVCGGRIQTLGEFNAMIFFAGADGLLTGNYLTTLGRDFRDDLQLIGQCGLTPSPR
ncbi:MAG: biotin synthase BioB [Nitrospiraceae bacterium]|nr:biotin synthase BioB [Nitrospiraceae bacterium]